MVYCPNCATENSDNLEQTGPLEKEGHCVSCGRYLVVTWETTVAEGEKVTDMIVRVCNIEDEEDDDDGIR